MVLSRIKLHELVEQIPEASLNTAEDLLSSLVRHPEEDEVLSEEGIAALDKGRRSLIEEEIISDSILKAVPLIRQRWAERRASRTQK